MLHSILPPFVRGILAAVLLALNACILVPLLVLFALVKLVLPFKAVRVPIDYILLGIAEAWIANNSGWMRLTQRMEWDIDPLPDLARRGWFLVISNHQSWVDILVLQHVFNRRIPLLKFFIKDQLKWVPVMGLAWWALDFPFMRRYSEDFLKKHPELRGKDQETTRKACAKFALIPTSVMSFLEGTRFTPGKHAQQQSPYRHLLKPKVGGLALAMNALGDKFSVMVDVTLVYPGGAPHFWDFMCGRMNSMTVRIRVREVPRHLAGLDYAGDAAARDAYATWAATLWRDKDALISEELNKPATLTR